MNQIKKYIERIKQLQSLYEVGQPQYNAFGIAINEAQEMLVKNCIKPAVIKSVCKNRFCKGGYEYSGSTPIKPCPECNIMQTGR